MLHLLAGDLLLSHAQLIAHGIAPDDDFKNGLARALRERLPAMYKDFRHYCHQEHPQPGGLWLWAGVDGSGRPLRIANLFTQEPPQQKGGHAGPAHTEYVNRALHQLRRVIVEQQITSVALPRLATGVGGLEWRHVEPLIRTQLGDLDVPVLVYADYQPGVMADEPLTARSGR